MGTFSFPLEIGDPQGSRYEVTEALVDTGATFTVVPGVLLRRLGVPRHARELFTLADGQQVEKDVGHTWVRVDGRSVITLVVFGEPGDAALLGAYTLEGLGLGVDPSNKRLIPTPRLLMGSRARSMFQRAGYDGHRACHRGAGVLTVEGSAGLLRRQLHAHDTPC